MSKRRAVLFLGLTVIGNCLGNLSTDLIKYSAKSANRLYANIRLHSKTHLLAKERVVTAHS
jgi:hypothetical protein